MASINQTTQVCDRKGWATLLQAKRPLITHINADTTWLLQLPYPESVATAPPGRTHFNILLDPWLDGPQSDVAWWFSTQWHVVPSSIHTIKDLDAVLREVEGMASGRTPDVEESMIDVVAISHEFTDHCHRATLEELPKTTPVFATDVAADLVRSWSHFDTVITMPALGQGVEWSRLTVGALPSWVAIGRVITPGDALYYHSAILLVFDLEGQGQAEAVVYSPHGIKSDDVKDLQSSGINTLAMLHGMHDVSIWMTKQLNLGALNGIRAVRASGAKYWIATHDEIKTGGGFIAPFLRRVQYSLKEAVEHEEQEIKKQDGKVPQYDYVELGSGDGMLLE